jgi:hypothetical protein
MPVGVSPPPATRHASAAWVAFAPPRMSGNLGASLRRPTEGAEARPTRSGTSGGHARSERTRAEGGGWLHLHAPAHT